MDTRTEARPGPGPGLADEVIRTVGLTKIYQGDVRAVDRLDLTVHRGEIFGLLGPNGAGKTTTAGMLTTRVAPTEGKAFVGGIDVWAQPARAKSLIGVVPQTNTLDRSLSVWDNLYYHGRFFGMNAKASKAESDRLLAQFKLSERAKVPVMALSGGMAQRLMVARAVMHRPSVLFLDEPTAGLDPQSRIALWEILGELHDEGQTILLTTHYMEEADGLCDRLAIIDRGRVLALDTPANLKASTGIDTVVTVSAIGDLEQLGTVLQAQIPGATTAKVADGVLRLGVKGAKGVLPAVVQAADEHGFTVTDLSINEPTLETVFIDLTGKDLRMSSDTETTTDDTGPASAGLPAGHRAISQEGVSVSPMTVFRALLLRDLHVLLHNMKEFIPRTVLQPLLLVFVFTRVFPEIGQGIGGGGGGAGAGAFSTLLVAGVIGSVILFQGIQAVALPLVQEFGFTKEIEDRVLAPLPVAWVAIEKVVAGALQCLLAAIIVFPIAKFVPSTPVDLTFNWPLVVTLIPLACLVASSLGLTFGTAFEPRTVPLLFGVIIVPLTFLGCIYFSWASLDKIPWLQYVVLTNPLVYISEGMRGALTTVPTMNLVAVYGAMIGFTAFFLWRGIKGFTRRVVA